MVRGIDYLRTRKKVASDKAIMQLHALDVFATDFKLYHIARHMELPVVPAISEEVLCWYIVIIVTFIIITFIIIGGGVIGGVVIGGVYWLVVVL